MDAAEVEAVVERLAALDVHAVAIERLGGLAVTVERLRNAAEALSSALLAELEDRGDWAAEGALSGTAWVAARTGTSPRDLIRRERAGRALADLPTSVTVARDGRLSPDHVRRLADCARRHPEAAARDEAVLAGLAELPASGFAAAALNWCGQAAAAEPARSEAGQVGRASQVERWRDVDGALRLSAVLRGGDADLVDATLDGRLDQLLRAARDGDPSIDGRTPAELRAQALVDLLTQTMRCPSSGSVPDRYRVAVLVHADEAADRLGVEAAVALCDAPAYRAVLSADSEVLDVGRLTKRWPAAIRRAVTLRDRGCAFPGCDRPPSWCDIHHCQPWDDDGHTEVDNGALLCRRHHTFVHANGWRVRIPQPRGRPQFHRPDGSRYTIDPWRDTARRE